MEFLHAVRQVTTDLRGTDKGDAPIQAALELVTLAWTTFGTAGRSWDDLGSEVMIIADELHPLPAIVVNTLPPTTDDHELRQAVRALVDQLVGRLDRDAATDHDDHLRRLTTASAAERLRTAAVGFR